MSSGWKLISLRPGPCWGSVYLVGKHQDLPPKQQTGVCTRMKPATPPPPWLEMQSRQLPFPSRLNNTIIGKIIRLSRLLLLKIILKEHQPNTASYAFVFETNKGSKNVPLS